MVRIDNYSVVLVWILERQGQFYHSLVKILVETEKINFGYLVLYAVVGVKIDENLHSLRLAEVELSDIIDGFVEEWGICAYHAERKQMHILSDIWVLGWIYFYNSIRMILIIDCETVVAEFVVVMAIKKFVHISGSSLDLRSAIDDIDNFLVTGLIGLGIQSGCWENNKRLVLCLG